MEILIKAFITTVLVVITSNLLAKLLIKVIRWIKNK